MHLASAKSNRAEGSGHMAISPAYLQKAVLRADESSNRHGSLCISAMEGTGQDNVIDK